MRVVQCTCEVTLVRQLHRKNSWRNTTRKMRLLSRRSLAVHTTRLLSRRSLAVHTMRLLSRRSLAVHTMRLLSRRSLAVHTRPSTYLCINLFSLFVCLLIYEGHHVLDLKQAFSYKQTVQSSLGLLRRPYTVQTCQVSRNFRESPEIGRDLQVSRNCQENSRN